LAAHQGHRQGRQEGGPGGELGVLVEINCETDFVARGDDFQAFCKDVAMHIAAAGPKYVSEDEIPAADLEREKRIFIQQAMDAGKPEDIAEKMVVGKMKKYVKEITLLDQPFVKDEETTIGALQTAFVAKCGENVKIRRFVRWQLGEGLEKKVDNFVEEVARMAQA
jgi:elongation factor Ts